MSFSAHRNRGLITTIKVNGAQRCTISQRIFENKKKWQLRFLSDIFCIDMIDTLIDNRIKNCCFRFFQN